MKKVFLILALLVSFGLDAQYVTNLAKNASSQSEGVFYYLPRNVIRIELTVEETGYFIGPYAEYASQMLGITDYIKENRTELNVKGIDIQLGSEPDPNAVFFIEFDEKSKEPIPNLIMDYDGIITAIGYDSIPSNLLITRNSYDYNDLVYKESTSASFIEILDIHDDEDDEDDEDEDEEGGSKAKKEPKVMTKEDKANVALEKIDKIRNANFELVSGFQEVSYGNTLNYMVDNLKSLENEYISLFKGKVVKNTYKVCFYVTPEKNQANAGVWVGKLNNGETVKLQFDTKNVSTNLTSLNDDILNAGQSNKVFYRMPAQTNCKVMLGNETIASKPMIINQFGEMRVISTKNNKVLFNPNTGQIISMTH